MSQEEILQRLKTQRKSLKSKITRSINALVLAIKDRNVSEADAQSKSLTDLFRNQFTNVHFDYLEAIDDAIENSVNVEAYQVVNGMNVEEYFKSVANDFDNAMKEYVEFSSAVLQASLVSEVDLPVKIATQVITDMDNFLSDQSCILSHDDIVSNAQKSISDLKALHESCRSKATCNNQCDGVLDKLSTTILDLSTRVTHVSGLAKSKRAKDGPNVSNTPRVHSTPNVSSDSNTVSSDSQTHTISVGSTPIAPQGHMLISQEQNTISQGPPGVRSNRSGTMTSSELRDQSAHAGAGEHQGGRTSCHSSGYSRYKKPDPPKFSGDRRYWPEFKAVWKQHALEYYCNDLERAHALKEALSGRPLFYVLPIYSSSPGAYSAIWSRLESVYDDVSLSVQSALDDLEKLKPVKDGDAFGLVKAINDIEMCYSQLKTIDNLSSISMVHIDNLCERLPSKIREDWEEKYQSLSPPDKIHPFPSFMEFIDLKRQVNLRRAERHAPKRSESRNVSNQSNGSSNQSNNGNNQQKVKTFHAGANESNQPKDQVKRDISCVIHIDDSKHSTDQCGDFSKLSIEKKLEALKECHACFRCFKTTHPRRLCKEKAPCKHCKLSNHHHLLCRKQTSQVTTAVSLGTHHSESGSSVLPIVQVKPYKHRENNVTVFFDGGSEATYITHDMIKRLHARKVFGPIDLGVTVMGNSHAQYSTDIYEVDLCSVNGNKVTVYAYGMESITGPVSPLDYNIIQNLFPSIDVGTIRRGTQVDILLGIDYFGYHPKSELAKAGEHLSVMSGVLGSCLQGSHPKLVDNTKYSTEMRQVLTQCSMVFNQSSSHVCNMSDIHPVQTMLCSAKTMITDFILGENMGTEINPKCGSCKCGKCPILGNTYSFEEEQQLRMIQDNLRYDSDKKVWTAGYPWIKDPHDLPDNYSAALATLRNTEKTLKRDSQWAKTYHEQIVDMVQRGVARKLDSNEMQNWDGPKFYISHLAVLNPKSKTTPVRIVFNSSQSYQGKSLNSFLAKGPDAYINNLMGVLLRWRENEQVLVGDIRKMYNSVHINPIEQHCHRFLWRDLDESRAPDVYIIQRVNMGDKPAGAIASEALYKTAEMFKCDYPKVADLLTQSTYVDDIIDSVPSLDDAVTLACNTSKVLKEAGFQVKSWLFSGEKVPRVDPSVIPMSNVDEAPQCSRVLGVVWNSERDVVKFIPVLNFSPKRKGVYTKVDLTVADVPQSIPLQLTRRMVLEQTMKLFDPFGFLSPFSLLAKSLLRETWVGKLGWDDPLSEQLRNKWVAFFVQLFQVANLEYDRCLKPAHAVGLPSLIILSDGSDLAYGCIAYIRWELSDQSVWCQMIMSKARIAPVNKVSTPQMELNGAVTSKRIRSIIEKECRFDFERVVHLVDSETVLAMLNKCSTRFRIYEGVRVGEIQAASKGDLSCWFWVSGETNTADWLTRGRQPHELAPGTEWWNGPSFMYSPISKWPIKSVNELHNVSNLPGEKKSVYATKSVESVPLLDYSRYRSARQVQWILARIISAIRLRFKGVGVKSVTKQDLEDARLWLIRDVQRSMMSELQKSNQGQYARLKPMIDDHTGLYVVGSRVNVHNPLSPEGKPQALLATYHPYTKLCMVDSHIDGGHRGRDATLARFRQQYWVAQGSKVAQGVCKQCQMCKKLKPITLKHCLGQLPDARLKASPPFTHVMLDLFGPVIVKAEVPRRATCKVYGVLFTDLYSRAVHVEVASGYDAESFKKALLCFSSVRGWPSVIYSDPGSQLVCVEKELQMAWKSMVDASLYKLSTENGLEWKFGPANSPWTQGAVESMVKNIKKAIKVCMTNQRLTYSEFVTVCKRAANLVNERPLGTLSSDDSEVSILTPNSLLLGRAFSMNPGYSVEASSFSDQRHVIAEVTRDFWKRWCQFYAPTLFSNRCKEKNSPNLKVGDVVVVMDSSPWKQGYYIAVVKQVYPSKDGIVRRVSLGYKNFRVGEKVHEYRGSPEVVITRGVKNLALLVGVDDKM